MKRGKSFVSERCIKTDEEFKDEARALPMVTHFIRSKLEGM